MSEQVLSPTQSSANPLPPRPVSTGSSVNTTPNIPTSQSSTPAQTAPRTRGGFEVDDDGENEGLNEDVQDDDVYEPSVTFDIDGSAPVIDQTSIDRTSHSPLQENGITPVPVQATDSPANMNSSFPSTTSPTSVSAPFQTVTEASVLANNASSILPKSRLAHDVVGILEDRIKDDPRGDIEAWLELIQEFKSRNKDVEVRQTYKKYLEVFPLASEQWCAFVRWEEEGDRKFEMEEIFRKALLQVPSVEFWSIYINYIRRRNPMQGSNSAKSYQIINQAFEFALTRVGMDKDSGKLWQDYIEFLKSGPGTVGGSGWQDNQKMDNLREAYRKALCVPTSALQTLWKEYDSFETSINKINGRKFLQERSPDYMTARGAFTQLQNLTRDLHRTSRPRLPPAMGCEGDIEYQQQVSLWKQWIQWEKEDNLVLQEEKLESYRDRVLFTYKQALMALQFWPEIWYDAASFCFENGREEDGLKLLNDGFTSNPESALLAFKLADRIESTTSNDDVNDPGAKSRMKKVREPYDKVLDALYTIDKKTEARMQLEVQKVESLAQNHDNGEGAGDEEVNASNIASKKAAVDAQIEAVRAGARAHLDMLSKIISHVWIALMRATRRIQGKGLPNEKGAGFRMTFNEARKRGKLTPDFYVESANVEWQCYRDATGTRILERGVKLYPEDNYLPLEYIKHLINKDDLTNARAVFETTVNRFTAGKTPSLVAKSKPLFAFFHDYESKFGELSQIVRLEYRMKELFPEDPALQQFSARYKTAGFDPMSVHPIISQSQLQPKRFLHSSIDTNDVTNSPIQRVIDQITTSNSPKRPLPFDDEDEDGPARKLARGESPLKGAAGRRLNQQQQQQQPARPTLAAPVPPPLPPQVMYLLGILPKASSYTETRFDPTAIHQLIRDVHLPPPGSIGSQRPPQPPQPTATPVWPPQYAQQSPMVPPPQAYMPPGVSQPQYGAAPFRYA